MTRTLTVSRKYPKNNGIKENRVAEPFSYIRLSGKWLSESGFSPGDKIKVQASGQKLIISK